MSATEPEGTEIYLVTVGRHAFGSGASLQEPNTIRTGQEKIGSFADDPETVDIDETILADIYYANGGYVYPTHGAVYRSANTLASNPIQLPPCYIYGGVSTGSIDQDDPLQSYVLVEFWPEGYANRNTTDWTITNMTLTGSNTSSGNGYLLSPVAQSDHYLLSVYNRLWSSYPFQEQYDCIMQDGTRATFNSVAEAQSATNPSLLSLVELQLPSTNQFAVSATLSITYEHTNANVFTQSININQTVYNRFNKYISRVQTIAPPGDTVEQNVLPNQFGTKTYTGFQKGFTILSATNTQTSPPTKVGVAYGASFGQSGGNFYFPLVDAIGDIRNGSTEPEDYPRFSVFTGKNKYDGIIRGLFQFQYADGSNILKLVVDGSTILASSGREIIQDDLVGLSIVSAQSANIQYDYSSADATFVSDSGGVTLSWEWTLPSDLVLLSTGELNINIATLLGD